MTTQEKQFELDQIAEEIKQFKGLDIARNCTHAVPGEGSPDARIMFIGEAPGFNEDQQGRPFVGQAGKLLEKTLIDILNLKRTDVYITNVIKYRPPNNRDPLPDEIEACRQWLDRQIAVISPKIIVTLGRFSMAKFIPGVTISRVHGVARFYQLSSAGSKLVIFPMYHPAAALRSGSVMHEFVRDFIKLKDLLSGELANTARPETVKKPVSQQSLF